MAVGLLLRAGAKETELVFRDGVQQSLAQEHDAGFRIATFRAPPEEIERARTLLARAPNDRAWCRRRWLVMLRLRGAPRARRLRWRKPRAPMVVVAVTASLRQRGPNTRGGLESTFEAVAEALSGLELEGVFRNVVGFL